MRWIDETTVELGIDWIFDIDRRGYSILTDRGSELIDWIHDNKHIRLDHDYHRSAQIITFVSISDAALFKLKFE